MNSIEVLNTTPTTDPVLLTGVWIYLSMQILSFGLGSQQELCPEISKWSRDTRNLRLAMLNSIT